MNRHEIIQDVIVVLATILIILGLQHYIGDYIQKWPWLAIIVGTLMFVFSGRISERL